VFNPQEEKLLQECKLSSEYFPYKRVPNVKKPKMRRLPRSTLNTLVLWRRPFIIADVMLYNIEIAQAFSAENTIKQELFYKSMLNSFEQAIVYMIGNGILNEFKIRLMLFIRKQSCKTGKRAKLQRNHREI
jgi:hypothetical protein